MIIPFFKKHLTIFIPALILGSLLFYFLMSENTLKIYSHKLTRIDDSQFFSRGQRYEDMDGDGKSESYVLTSYSDNPVIELFNSDESFMDVIRVYGRYLDESPSYYFMDSDHDKHEELYIFSYRNDTIWLNAYEPTGDDGHFLKNLFVDEFHPLQEQNDVHLIAIDHALSNVGGTEQIIAVLRAGFSKSLRKVFLIDPRNGEVNSSVNSGAGYSQMQLLKSEEGVLQELLLSSSSFENFDEDDSVLFNDHSAWIISYNEDLSDTIFTVEYPENKSYVFAIKTRDSTGEYIYALVLYQELGEVYIEKLDKQGKLIRRKFVMDGLKRTLLLNLLIPIEDYLVVNDQVDLTLYDKNLNLVKIIHNSGNFLYGKIYRHKNIITELGFFVSKADNKLLLINDELKVLASCKTKNAYLLETAVYTVKEKTDKIMILGFNVLRKTYHFKFSENIFYPFRYPIYFLFFILWVTLFFMVFYIPYSITHRRQLVQQRISSLQLQSIQNQLQPHFTFNVLNSIGSMIYKDKKQEAYEYLNLFSDMLRNTLVTRSEVYWTIQDELDFISNYLKMENMRFDNRFIIAYHIPEGTRLDLRIPKLMIQGFVENAVRHGLVHKKGKGHLQLRLENQEKHLAITVEDDGIGRELASTMRQHGTGTGNAIIKEFIAVYNDLHKVKFDFELEDLYDDEGRAKGTKVRLKIPVDLDIEYLNYENN